jgi:hypothetical protein
VDHTVLVRRFHRLGDLARYGKGLLDRKRALSDAIGERRALDQLEDQRGSSGALL